MRRDVERTAVVLDHHPLWLDAIEEVLRPLALEIVAKTTSMATALDAIATMRPTLFLMDLDVEAELALGINCVQRARELAPDVDVVVLSGRSGGDVAEAVFAVGATAYVLKTAEPEDIVTAVRQVFDHSIFLRWALSSAASAPKSISPNGTSSLTRRELEILRLVSEGHSNAQVARTLWITEQTVKFHLSNIFRKLDVGNRTEAGRWAQRHGVLASEGVDA